jgi:Methane oxygenase PmoA
MTRACFYLATTFAAALLVSRATSAAEFTVEQTDLGVKVKLDGKLFTEYLIQSGKKPSLWPIIGPTGKAMTRPWPIDKSELANVPKEDITGGSGAKAMGKPHTDDHPHHRSLWFGHQKVNDANVWTESGNSTGSEKHREFKEVSGGKKATIVTVNDWLDKDGKKLLEDERKITCSTDGDNRVIDFDITLKATEEDVKFGDDKDGLFGLRVPDTMRVEANKGGRFVNSEGQVNEDQAWGKPAKWMDYQGPVDGDNLGIAILNHPSSYGYPTHWHTRGYGLFAANPFGLKMFGEAKPGDYMLKKGDTMTFRYRVIFHKGDEREGHIAEAFAKYAKEN